MHRIHHFVAAVLVAASSTACAGIGEHPRAELPSVPEKRAWASWDEVLAAPTPLDVTAFQTGLVYVGADVLIDEHNPRTPESVKHEQWVPALSYLVKHPRAGRFLLDTGVPRASADGRCDFGVPPFFTIRCVATAEHNIAAHLHREGVRATDLAFIAISHLHGDHAGGLAPLAEDGPIRVALTEHEWTAANRDLRTVDGYIGDQLRAPYGVIPLPFQRAIEMPYLGRVLDVFGDGSTWIIPTTGHTRGELSVLLNTTSGPLLFTFDAAHLRANVDAGAVPGFTVDRDAAHDSLSRLNAFRRAYPRVTTYFGHEPDQWAGKPARVVLASDLSRAPAKR